MVSESAYQNMLKQVQEKERQHRALSCQKSQVPVARPMPKASQLALNKQRQAKRPDDQVAGKACYLKWHGNIVRRYCAQLTVPRNKTITQIKKCLDVLSS